LYVRTVPSLCVFPKKIQKSKTTLALCFCTWCVRSEFGSLEFKQIELQFGSSSPYFTGPVRFRRLFRIRKKSERPALMILGWSITREEHHVLFMVLKTVQRIIVCFRLLK
jgi:hypothetical protein